MLDIFAKVKNPALKGMIIWVPMVPGDSALEAAELVSPEKRLLMQAWDSKRSVGDALSKTLHLKCPAWDVYLIYEPGVQWLGDEAPQPSFWMHQLTAADPSLHLNPSRFEQEVRKALGETVQAAPRF